MTAETIETCHCGGAPVEDCGNGMTDICRPCLIAWEASGEPEECPCGGRWYAFTGRPANTYNAWEKSPTGRLGREFRVSYHGTARHAERLDAELRAPGVLILLGVVLARRGFANVAVGNDVVPVHYLGLATLSRDLTDEEGCRYHIYPVLALTSEPQPRI